MRLFQNERHVSLLHAINEELLNHKENLQRALDGKSAFYLPNGNQQQQIATEQSRIDSMLLGVSALQKYWQVRIIDRGQTELSPEDFTTLRVGAGVAHLQAMYCQLDKAHPTYTDAEKQGLLELFLYFDCKLDARNPANKEYYQYDSLHQNVGYVAEKR